MVVARIDSLLAEASNRSLKAADARLAEMQKSGRMLKQEVDEEDIAEVVSRWTHIPVSRLMEGEVQKLIHMEERLHERVIGQDEAINAVSNAMRRARAGLASHRDRELEDAPALAGRAGRARRATAGRGPGGG